MKISRPTIDRILKDVRIKLKKKRRCTTKPGTLLKNLIPLQFFDRESKEPGYAEIDLVAHCGDNAGGDNAHIEQKNWTCVREILGYHRIESEESIKLMNALYRGTLRLYINFFQPVQKCIMEKREGTKIKKYYDEAKTPYQRLRESPYVEEEID